MIFFFRSGRLGNQLFQYHALRAVYPSTPIFFFSLNEIKCNFQINDHRVFFVNNKYFVLFAKKFFFSFMKNLSYKKRIKFITESEAGQVKSNEFSKSIFNILVLKDIYFQNASYVKKYKKVLQFNKEISDLGKSWADSKFIDFNDSDFTFIHLRHGDYVAWPNHEYPAILELRYYFESIKYLERKAAKTRYIVTSDDLVFSKKIFGGNKNYYVSDNKPAVDMYLMSKCKHGILSASSFSWWGSFLSKERYRDETQMFLAPKFWFGHRSKQQEPKNFEFEWITYLNP